MKVSQKMFWSYYSIITQLFMKIQTHGQVNIYTIILKKIPNNIYLATEGKFWLISCNFFRASGPSDNNTVCAACKLKSVK